MLMIQVLSFNLALHRCALHCVPRLTDTFRMSYHETPWDSIGLAIWKAAVRQGLLTNMAYTIMADSITFAHVCTCVWEF